ncbi:hypothetical protein BT67DRAFT_480464 [Trichocladium antarcticum]|uniref:Uncharacterized protein n=1 Tax=Trichocladium antarcticum TaxID=1450529 RepID=A0AAN6UH83_9PEZI|nr:hypothetical protein BT67DRAFT_480464 [Trichocladium antarcticum]
MTQPSNTRPGQPALALSPARAARPAAQPHTRARQPALPSPAPESDEPSPVFSFQGPPRPRPARTFSGMGFLQATTVPETDKQSRLRALIERIKKLKLRQALSDRVEEMRDRRDAERARRMANARVAGRAGGGMFHPLQALAEGDGGAARGAGAESAVGGGSGEPSVAALAALAWDECPQELWVEDMDDAATWPEGLRLWAFTRTNASFPNVPVYAVYLLCGVAYYIMEKGQQSGRLVKVTHALISHYVELA